MKTSFHLNTFWFHVEWEKDGRRGRDQHGRLWLNMHNPVDESGVMRAGVQTSKTGSITINTKAICK